MFPLWLAILSIFYLLSGYWLWKLIKVFYYCKGKEILTHATTCMNLENILLSEISQSHTHTQKQNFGQTERGPEPASRPGFNGVSFPSGHQRDGADRAAWLAECDALRDRHLQILRDLSTRGWPSLPCWNLHYLPISLTFANCFPMRNRFLCLFHLTSGTSGSESAMPTDLL